MISLQSIGYAKCPECDRVFDLDIEDQAEEWFYGHDCFVEEES
jgi:hypothetical protein